MLYPVGRHPGLRAAHADKGALGNIIVDPVDIRIGVVNDVVLLFPDEIITAQGIQRKAEQLVHPFTGGIAAVVGVMHDIKSDTGKYKPQNQTTASLDGPGHWREKQKCI